MRSLLILSLSLMLLSGVTFSQDEDKGSEASASKKDREFVSRGKKILESDTPVIQIQRTPIPKDIADYYRHATERERQYSFEEEYKVRTALEYLIFGRIDESVRSIGGSKARQWNEKLEKLIRKNTFSF